MTPAGGAPAAPAEFGPPVVVGGVGGSGTRVVAQMLLDLGYFLGPDLNQANDNVWFTVLFRRPGWYHDETAGGGDTTPQIARAFDLFESALFGQPKRSIGDRLFVRAAANDVAKQLPEHQNRRKAWGKRLLEGNPDPPAAATGWGWKEPNSHVYIPQLAARWPGLRYVLVIRHGLDMVYSENQRQTDLWAERFGISPDLPPEVRSLRWWLFANERAIRYGRDLLGDRFLLLNFDDLCRDPAPAVSALLGLLGRGTDAPTVDRLAATVREPSSAERWREHGLDAFSDDDLERVRALGFEVATDR